MKIYFIGVCGVMMAPLAVAMQNMGHTVRGSDKGFYPPISTYLKENNISLDIGYKEEHITEDIDLAVFGAAVLPDNPEVQKVINLGIKHYAGYAKFLRDFFREENNIVVAGTYGKTTTSTFIAHLLTVAGFDPSFALGGLPINYPDGVRKGNGKWSVIEGDEYINARNDRVSKFLYYNPTHLVLTSASYDHLDVFPTEEEYIKAYSDLVESMPDGGKIIAVKGAPNLEKILKPFSGNRDIIWVDVKDAAENGLSELNQSDKTFFKVKFKGKEYLFESDLIGTYPFEDITLGIIWGLEEGIDIQKIQEAVISFKGVRRRLEVKRNDEIMVIDDLAHNPIKAKATITSIKNQFPERRLIAIFEPHTLSSRMRSSLSLYKGSFDGADLAFIAPIYHPFSVREDERITSIDIQNAIGENAQGFLKYDDLKNKIKEELKAGDILVFMSSGTVGGLIDYFSFDSDTL